MILKLLVKGKGANVSGVGVNGFSFALQFVLFGCRVVGSRQVKLSALSHKSELRLPCRYESPNQ